MRQPGAALANLKAAGFVVEWFDAEGVAHGAFEIANGLRRRRAGRFTVSPCGRVERERIG